MHILYTRSILIRRYTNDSIFTANAGDGEGGVTILRAVVFDTVDGRETTLAGGSFAESLFSRPGDFLSEIVIFLASPSICCATCSSSKNVVP